MWTLAGVTQFTAGEADWSPVTGCHQLSVLRPCSLNCPCAWQSCKVDARDRTRRSSGQSRSCSWRSQHSPLSHVWKKEAEKSVRTRKNLRTLSTRSTQLTFTDLSMTAHTSCSNRPEILSENNSIPSNKMNSYKSWKNWFVQHRFCGHRRIKLRFDNWMSPSVWKWNHTILSNLRVKEQDQGKLGNNLNQKKMKIEWITIWEVQLSPCLEGIWGL